uniref:Uncharacterized protein n=1 Tax=Timema bartmani TaxID=61472 RepID=A0A7R9I4F4_9NEOP|nr:unnamed protein product [Timema bartmani]
MASLVLTDSSQLTSDSQNLEVSCELSVSTKEAMGLPATRNNIAYGPFPLILTVSLTPKQLDTLPI